MLFANRFEAGKELAQALDDYEGMENVMVLGIPRGGVEVARAVADVLKAPLSVVITRKIGFPGSPEAAIGAVGPDGKHSVDDSWIDYSGISKEYISSAVKEAKAEIKQQYKLYVGKAAPPTVKGKVVIVVDDGAATGHSMRAACTFLKAQKPKKLVAGLPVAPSEVVTALQDELYDEVVCVHKPLVFYAVGEFYREFEQLDDKTVQALLKK